jgi:hypothetical protein
MPHFCPLLCLARCHCSEETVPRLDDIIQGYVLWVGKAI